MAVLPFNSATAGSGVDVKPMVMASKGVVMRNSESFPETTASESE